MKKLIFGVIAVCLWWAAAAAADADFLPLSGRVVDETGVLTPQTKAAITKILSTDKNNQVAVAVVKNLRGQDGRDYGVELARCWQLGQKGKDNGVLILLAVEDRYAGIEVGYGLEGVLTDALSGRILQNVVLPPLKKPVPDYNQALLNGAAAVMSVISDGKLGEGADGEDASADALSVLITLLIIYLMLSGRWPRGGGGMFFRGGGRGMGGGFFGGGGSFGGGGAGRRF